MNANIIIKSQINIAEKISLGNHHQKESDKGKTPKIFVSF